MSTLKTNNVLGTPSLVSPAGQLATEKNFIDPYTYAMQYQPELIKQLHLQKGKGKLTKFSQIVGNESSYAADKITHAEMGDLHTVSEGVAVSGNDFTTTNNHGLRVNDEIMISDGTIEKFAVVSAITSSTEFTALNAESGDFGFANVGVGPVTVSCYSNTWNKGDTNFTEGHEWNLQYFSNYSQIIKSFSDINESDMASMSWLEAPQFPGGEAWYSVDFARTLDKYDNTLEMTHCFHKRLASDSAAAIAGKARGMKGIVPQVEERGNIGNEYITTLAHLSEIAKRIKQQGGSTSYTVWHDHTQGAYFRTMLSGLNAHYSTGANFGTFQNDKDMALKLDFKSVYIDGITFHFTPWDILDDTSLLGAANFVDTSIAALFVPSGDMSVLVDGNTYSKPYLSIRYRRKGGIDRYKKLELYGGPIGTNHKKDTMEAHYKTEQLNELVGANQWFVIRKGTGIYTGS